MARPYLLACAVQQARQTISGRCEMKMTDQMERDYFQGELANGRANRGESTRADDLNAASVVMAVWVISAMLMIWLGR